MHRLSRIYGRDDVVIDRSTMSGWVGQSEKLFEPLVAALGRYALAGEKIVRCGSYDNMKTDVDKVKKRTAVFSSVF